MEGLLTLLLSDKLNLSVNADTAGKEHSPEADKLRSEIRQSLSEKRVEPGSESKPPEAKA